MSKEPYYEFTTDKECDCSIDSNCDCSEVLYNFHLEYMAEMGVDDLNDLLVTGSLGRWNGRHDIQPEIIATYADVLDRMESTIHSNTRVYKRGEKIDYIEYDNIHHDGTNIYKITPIYNLTKKEIIEFIEDKAHKLLDLKLYAYEVVGVKKDLKYLIKEELVQIALELNHE